MSTRKIIRCVDKSSHYDLVYLRLVLQYELNIFHYCTRFSKLAFDTYETNSLKDIEPNSAGCTF